MNIPTLETERLIMREFRNDTDFESWAAFYSSDSTRFYGGPLDRAATWRAAAAMMGHWVIRGYGPWAIEEKASGEFCGMVGLWNPEGWPEPEITWAMIDQKQGSGFAHEAAKRSRTYAYETLGWDSVYSCISAGNKASIGLAQKLGATLDREVVDQMRGTMLIYRHQR